jgi:DNA-binding winged helix-turn-helix (wHTH) protein/TolB-like protein
VIRFAGFEVDPDAGILRRDGIRVKLQDLPFRLLAILLQRPGVVITRDELRQSLWGAATYVDAEAGLNTAIAKLREALGDDAESPRFIETLPKRGYRFVGTLDSLDVGARPASPIADRRSWRTWWLAIAALLVVVLAAATYYAPRAATPITIAVVRFHNETGDAARDRLAESLTDAVVVSLAANTEYGVIGNSPLLRTNRIFQDVRRIAASLDARYVVLGQLQNGDGGLLVRAHFIRARDENHLWAGKIELAGVSEIERVVTTAVSDGVASGLNRR